MKPSPIAPGSPVAIVVGSHHAESQSLKVAQYLSSRLAVLALSQEVFLLDLAQAALPLWQAGIVDEHAQVRAVWAECSKQLAASDAVILVVPEWHGMAPAAVKNLLLYCDAHELAHKPCLIVGVSGGDSGAYPVAELRMSAGKNTRLCFTPDHLIVRHVDEVLNEEEAGSAAEQALRCRADYALRVLLAYGRALSEVRRAGVIDLKAFPYGQ